ncbi:MAG TPA: serine O-acetyltransferase EpsC [Polyangiaceae bacterium]|nr:serine O-acetyltransferase EpsC [Polyangiaceae bacterium]
MTGDGPRRSSRPPAAPDPASPLADVVDALCTANEDLLRGWRRERGRHLLPSRDAVAGVVEDLRAVLFPGHFGSSDLSASGLRYYVGARLEKARAALTEQVRRGLSFACEHGVEDCSVCAGRAFDVMEELVTRLPAVRALLESDVHAAYDGDPAAKFIDETLFCYPGVAAIIEHRIAHELYRLDVPLIPRIVSELSHSATGIDIHPGAEIGGSFFIDHGTGVVIGETCSIGQRVRIYQGVTLGARGFASDENGRLVKEQLRHPIVEDDVVIYAGATILGRITIGKGATIGGNVWLTYNVPPGSRVTQAQARQETFWDGSGI